MQDKATDKIDTQTADNMLRVPIGDFITVIELMDDSTLAECTNLARNIAARIVQNIDYYEIDYEYVGIYSLEFIKCRKDISEILSTVDSANLLAWLQGKIINLDEKGDPNYFDQYYETNFQNFDSRAGKVLLGLIGLISSSSAALTEDEPTSDETSDRERLINKKYRIASGTIRLKMLYHAGLLLNLVPRHFMPEFEAISSKDTQRLTMYYMVYFDKVIYYLNNELRKIAKVDP